MAAASRAIRGFGASERGNIAILFGLLLAPLLFVAGAALDAARAIDARASIQEAADAALLRVARLRTEDPGLTEAELTSFAREIFDRAVANTADLFIGAFEVNFDAATETYSLALDATQKTTLLKVAGVKTLDVGTTSEVRLGAPPYLEVVMALDNTGSMNDFNKIGDLKRSATALVETLFAASAADVRIGLVPFAQYVNVGTTNAGAAWLTAAPAGWIGCVGSRAYPLNTEDQGYGAAPVPAIAGTCPQPILPLSNDSTEILAAIDGMTGGGWTYIAEGVAWGRRVLSPGAPFSGGLTAAELEKRQGTKALIVLTDGENTRAPTYPLHDSSDRALADQLTERLCDETKKDGVVVYTIAFRVSDPAVRSLLEGCGSAAGNYFEPSNAAELSAAFERIAARLRNLSISG
jgi:Flp pilus assembly protein TadG